MFFIFLKAHKLHYLFAKSTSLQRKFAKSKNLKCVVKKIFAFGGNVAMANIFQKHFGDMHFNFNLQRRCEVLNK